MNIKRHIVLGLAIGALAFVSGCADSRPQPVPVSGVVNIDGKPLTLGFITLIPSKGRSAMGDIDKQGHFTLTTYQKSDGAMTGTHKVEIIAREAISEKQGRWHAPKKYTNQATSGVTVEITEQTDDLKIDISWDGGKPFIETDS
jgi:hypothetical protein